MPIIIPDDLPYTAPGIECLRLGARRGGTGIGCCAIDVFQGFNNPPDAICPPIPFYDGDSYAPVLEVEGHLHVGDVSNEDAFLAYLVHGSFTSEPAPDHAFIAVLTDSQCKSETGKAWLSILKREGFKWVGCTSNSVYAEYHPNHIFLLVRSTHDYMEDAEIERLKNPPSYWQTLSAPSETPEERYQKLLGSYAGAHCFPNAD